MARTEMVPHCVMSAALSAPLVARFRFAGVAVPDVTFRVWDVVVGALDWAGVPVLEAQVLDDFAEVCCVD
jgi:hypothetical protein